jgi:hypothetical protein
MPPGKANDVTALAGSGPVDVGGDVTGAAGSERSSRGAFGMGAAIGMASGSWEKGTGRSVAVRVGVALLGPASVLVGMGLVMVIWVAGGAGGLGVVRAWTAGGRAATREEKRDRATATWERRMGFIVRIA